jgi:hypothetical protein
MSLVPFEKLSAQVFKVKTGRPTPLDVTAIAELMDEDSPVYDTVTPVQKRELLKAATRAHRELT